MDSTSLVHKIYSYSSDGLHFMSPNPNLRTNEADVVCFNGFHYSWVYFAC